MEDTSSFMLDNLYSPEGIPSLTCMLFSPKRNGFLIFTSGVTPAEPLGGSMAAKSFQSTYLRTTIGRVRVQDQDRGSTDFIYVV